MSLAVAFSIVAIVLSLPALFLSIYVLVCLKAREMADSLLAQSTTYSTDRPVIRELNQPEPPEEPDMYGVGVNGPIDYEDL